MVWADFNFPCRFLSLSFGHLFAICSSIPWFNECAHRGRNADLCAEDFVLGNWLHLILIFEFNFLWAICLSSSLLSNNSIIQHSNNCTKFTQRSVWPWKLIWANFNFCRFLWRLSFGALKFLTLQINLTFSVFWVYHFISFVQLLSAVCNSICWSCDLLNTWLKADFCLELTALPAY